MERGLLLIGSLLSHIFTTHTIGMLGPILVLDGRNFSLMWANRMVNIAGLAALATTFLEKYVGFWAAFIPPAGAMALGMIPLVLFRTKFGKSLQRLCNRMKTLMRHISEITTFWCRPSQGS